MHSREHLAVALIGGCKSVPDKMKETRRQLLFPGSIYSHCNGAGKKLSTNPDPPKKFQSLNARVSFSRSAWQRTSVNKSRNWIWRERFGAHLKLPKRRFAFVHGLTGSKSTLAVCQTRVAVLDKRSQNEPTDKLWGDRSERSRGKR